MQRVSVALAVLVVACAPTRAPASREPSPAPAAITVTGGERRRLPSRRDVQAAFDSVEDVVARCLRAHRGMTVTVEIEIETGGAVLARVRPHARGPDGRARELDPASVACVEAAYRTMRFAPLDQHLSLIYAFRAD